MQAQWYCDSGSDDLESTKWLTARSIHSADAPGVSNPWPAGHMRLKF